MRLVFLGTPEFAVPTLEKIAGQAVAVVTQPDRPRGRGGELGAPPVKECALRLGLPVQQPEKIRTPEFLAWLRNLAPEALVVVGYGKIIPQAIIDIPPCGVINVHASLLPKYRGAAPIQWAIANGETRTGVTTMRIDAGLDTGDILLQEETAIAPQETAIEVGERLAGIGAGLLDETLRGLATGSIVPRPQDPSQATLAPLLKKEDGQIDWNWPAASIHDRARGFLPWPGAYTWFRGQLLHLWKTRPAGELSAAPGSLEPMRNRLLVACGSGTALELLEVQLEGKKRLLAAAFLNGHRVVHNELLGERSR